MSISRTPEQVNAAGLGCLIVLLALAWFISLLGQLVGVAWYWPWIFFAGLIIATTKAAKNGRRKNAQNH